MFPKTRLSTSISWIVVAISFPLKGVAESSWTEREIRILKSLHIPATLSAPIDPSNRYSNEPRAAELGSMFFYDTKLSGNGELSCASCHQPEKFFTDGLVRGAGIGHTLRNTPTVVNAAFNAWFYWDGRKDSLWSQALNPFEAKEEMGGSRLAVVREIGNNKKYLELYVEIFGPFPFEVLSDQLPEHAGPLGTNEMRMQWQLLGVDTQRLVNQVYVNVGKSIAAFERTLVSSRTRFDAYVDWLLVHPDSPADGMLNKIELNGIKLFIDSKRTQCLQCHNGPMLTNGGFHNIGSGNFTGNSLDFGRVFGLHAVLFDEFNCRGPYSDAGPDDCQELKFLNTDPHVPLEGAFKVPSLRNLTRTAPYFHDGRFASLREVIEYYRNPPDSQANGPHELRALTLTSEEESQLISFLQLFSSPADEITSR